MTSRTLAEQWPDQTQVLEQLATGHSLAEVLTTLVQMIERHVEGMFGSILLLDEDFLRLGVAPSLPDEYNLAIDGIRIGPTVGSCGSAAYHNRLIVTEDVLTDSRWERYRDVATRHGLRACWSHPIRSAGGSVLGTFALYYDHPRRPSPIELTNIEIAAHIAGIAIERRESERALRDEQALLRVLMDNMPDAIYFKDRDCRFTRVNRAQARLLGLESTDDAIGRLDAEFFPDAAASAYLADDRSVLERGEPLIGKIESNGQEGPLRRWFSTTKVPIRNSSGVVTGLVGVSHDITETKTAQDELRRLHEATASEFNAIFQAYPDLQFRLRVDGTIVDYHASVESEMYVPSDRFLGQRMQNILPPDVACRFEDAIETVGRTGSLVSIEYPLPHAGHQRIYEARILPLGCDEFIVIARDITQRKRAEEQSRIDQERLRSLASELSLAEERERHRIAADLHDRIGQTMGFAQMKMERLRDSLPADGPGETLRECIGLLRQTMQDARTLMFDLSPPVLYDLGLEAAAGWLVERHQAQAGTRVCFVDDGNTSPIDEAVRVTLFRALRELLTNVTKHASAQEVRVSIQHGDDQIRIQVSDDGIGFDVDAHRIPVEGTGGFGLFSIREQLGRLNGRMEIHSAPGAGTRIVLWGPVEQAVST